MVWWWDIEKRKTLEINVLRNLRNWDSILLKSYKKLKYDVLKVIVSENKHFLKGRIKGIP